VVDLTGEIVVKGYLIKRGLFYTREHEWLHVEGDEGRIGITDYAQKSLHEIVFVELPPVGTRVKRGDTIATVESIKAISDVYAPISGTVIAVNQKLTDRPELLNADPYGSWIVKVKIERPSEVNDLLEPEEYAAYIRTLE
jgi:glycine cleavage system H protein